MKSFPPPPAQPLCNCKPGVPPTSPEVGVYKFPSGIQSEHCVDILTCKVIILLLVLQQQQDSVLQKQPHFQGPFRVEKSRIPACRLMGKQFSHFAAWATSCLSQLTILLEDDLLGPLSIRQVSFKSSLPSKKIRSSQITIQDFFQALHYFLVDKITDFTLPLFDC